MYQFPALITLWIPQCQITLSWAAKYNSPKRTAYLNAIYPVYGNIFHKGRLTEYPVMPIRLKSRPFFRDKGQPSPLSPTEAVNYMQFAQEYQEQPRLWRHVHAPFPPLPRALLVHHSSSFPQISDVLDFHYNPQAMKLPLYNSVLSTYILLHLTLTYFVAFGLTCR